MIIENKDYRLVNPEIFNQVEELVFDVDTLKDFMDEGGALADPGERRIVPRCIEVLDDAINSPNKAVVLIKDCHSYYSVEIKFYGVHSIKGKEGAEEIDEIKPYETKSFVFRKNSTNFMWAPGMIEFLLLFKNLKRVKIIGVLSCKCVDNGAVSLKTFFDEMNRDVEVEVLADAIDTYDAPGHDRVAYTESAIKHMEYNNIKVLGKVLK